jgi:hypothetical protein
MPMRSSIPSHKGSFGMTGTILNIAILNQASGGYLGKEPRREAYPKVEASTHSKQKNMIE